MEKNVTLVIGGSSDIGKEIIERVVSFGGYVTYTYYSKNIDNEFSSEIKNKVDSLKVDLSTDEGIEQLCRMISVNNFSNVVYCSGVNPSKLVIEMDNKDIDRSLKVNYIAPIKIFTAFSRYCISHKRESNKLVYISSIASTKVKSGNSIYGSAKIGVERYLANVALELARFNTRTLCISPSFINTKMLTNYLKTRGENLNSIIKNIPTREILIPEDISNVVLGFISGKIKTTGTTLNIGNGEKVFL